MQLIEQFFSCKVGCHHSVKIWESDWVGDRLTINDFNAVNLVLFPSANCSDGSVTKSREKNPKNKTKHCFPYA